MDREYTREEYLALESEAVCGTPEHPGSYRRRYIETGLYFGEITVDSKKGGEPIEIVQITDMHFNTFNSEDEKNEELMLTKQFRMWNRDGESRKSAKTAMDYAKLFDKIVITGDTLDFLSEGAIEMMDELVWSVSDKVVACIGGHELTRQMQTGEQDKTSLEERLATVQAAWKNDIFYHSEILGDKVMIILMNNDRARYNESQLEKFTADLEIARRDELTVLIFQHEPISTGNPNDRDHPAFIVYPHKTANFYDDYFIGSAKRPTDDTTGRLYRKIRENADIIKGIFCGHKHSAFYTEVLCEDGKIIPQHNLEGNVYAGQAGHVLRITVK